jgi:hypothetical protein
MVPLLWLMEYYKVLNYASDIGLNGATFERSSTKNRLFNQTYLFALYILGVQHSP